MCVWMYASMHSCAQVCNAGLACLVSYELLVAIVGFPVKRLNMYVVHI